MSYITKGSRIFESSSYLEPPRLRSEGRMKTYSSATDLRAWSDVVEERRQHILDYQAKDRVGPYPGKLVPVEHMVEVLLCFKNERIKQLEKRIDYLEKIIDVYYSKLDLTSEQKEKLDKLNHDLQVAYGQLAVLNDEVCECSSCSEKPQSKTRRAKSEETRGTRDRSKLQRKNSIKKRKYERLIDEDKGKDKLDKRMSELKKEIVDIEMRSKQKTKVFQGNVSNITSEEETKDEKDMKKQETKYTIQKNFKKSLTKTYMEQNFVGVDKDKIKQDYEIKEKFEREYKENGTKVDLEDTETVGINFDKEENKPTKPAKTKGDIFCLKKVTEDVKKEVLKKHLKNSHFNKSEGGIKVIDSETKKHLITKALKKQMFVENNLNIEENNMSGIETKENRNKKQICGVQDIIDDLKRIDSDKNQPFGDIPFRFKKEEILIEKVDKIHCENMVNLVPCDSQIELSTSSPLLNKNEDCVKGVNLTDKIHQNKNDKLSIMSRELQRLKEQEHDKYDDNECFVVEDRLILERTKLRKDETIDDIIFSKKKDEPIVNKETDLVQYSGQISNSIGLETISSGQQTSSLTTKQSVGQQLKLEKKLVEKKSFGLQTDQNDFLNDYPTSKIVSNPKQIDKEFDEIFSDAIENTNISTLKQETITVQDSDSEYVEAVEYIPIPEKVEVMEIPDNKNKFNDEHDAVVRSPRSTSSKAIESKEELHLSITADSNRSSKYDLLILDKTKPLRIKDNKCESNKSRLLSKRKQFSYSKTDDKKQQTTLTKEVISTDKEHKDKSSMLKSSECGARKSKYTRDISSSRDYKHDQQPRAKCDINLKSTTNQNYSSINKERKRILESKSSKNSLQIVSKQTKDEHAQQKMAVRDLPQIVQRKSKNIQKDKVILSSSPQHRQAKTNLENRKTRTKEYIKNEKITVRGKMYQEMKQLSKCSNEIQSLQNSTDYAIKSMNSSKEFTQETDKDIADKNNKLHDQLEPDLKKYDFKYKTLRSHKLESINKYSNKRESSLDQKESTGQSESTCNKLSNEHEQWLAHKIMVGTEEEKEQCKGQCAKSLFSLPIYTSNDTKLENIGIENICLRNKNEQLNLRESSSIEGQEKKITQNKNKKKRCKYLKCDIKREHCGKNKLNKSAKEDLTESTKLNEEQHRQKEVANTTKDEFLTKDKKHQKTKQALLNSSYKKRQKKYSKHNTDNKRSEENFSIKFGNKKGTEITNNDKLSRSSSRNLACRHFMSMKKIVSTKNVFPRTVHHKDQKEFTDNKCQLTDLSNGQKSKVQISTKRYVQSSSDDDSGTLPNDYNVILCNSCDINKLDVNINKESCSSDYPSKIDACPGIYDTITSDHVKPLIPYNTSTHRYNYLAKPAPITLKIQKGINEKIITATKSGFFLLIPSNEPLSHKKIPAGYFAGESYFKECITSNTRLNELNVRDSYSQYLTANIGNCEYTNPIIFTYQVSEKNPDNDGCTHRSIKLVPSTRLSRVLSGDSSSLSPIKISLWSSSINLPQILSMVENKNAVTRSTSHTSFSQEMDRGCSNCSLLENLHGIIDTSSNYMEDIIQQQTKRNINTEYDKEELTRMWNEYSSYNHTDYSEIGYSDNEELKYEKYELPHLKRAITYSEQSTTDDDIELELRKNIEKLKFKHNIKRNCVNNTIISSKKDKPDDIHDFDASINYLENIIEISSISGQSAVNTDNENDNNTDRNAAVINMSYDLQPVHSDNKDIFQLFFEFMANNTHKEIDCFSEHDVLNQLCIKQTYCSEQRKIATDTIQQLDNIKNVIEERDDLRRKLEQSQQELEELKTVIASDSPQSKIPNYGEGQSEYNNLDRTIDTTLNYQQINALETEIDQMVQQIDTSQTEPEQIKKEFEKVLKQYCSKLSIVQKQNNELKSQIYEHDKIFAILGCREHTPLQLHELKHKIDRLNSTIRERDTLKNKVNKLEKQLYAYSYLPEDVEIFKQRSMLLDDVLEDRDRLSQKVEELRSLDQEVTILKKKACRVTELEDNLLKMSKEKALLEEEMNELREKCSAVEIENYNKHAEGDTLRSRLICMEHEMESLKYLCEDKECLILEKNHLKDSLDEYIRMQGDFEEMKKHMKRLEVFKAERDIFKSKYENLIGLECECDILRTQVEKAKTIERERDALETQVEDLENCIAEQENEIKRLVCHIDMMAKERDEEQSNFKRRLMQMREELEKKDSLIITAEEKLCSVQNELRNSIEGLSGESQKYKIKNEHLESIINSLQRETNELERQNEEIKSFAAEVQIENQKLLEHIVTLKGDNENFVTHIKYITEENLLLIKKLEEKEDSLNTLKEVLKDHEPILEEFEKSKLGQRRDHLESDSIYILTNELEYVKEENRQLHEKLIKLRNVIKDQEFDEFLTQTTDAAESVELNHPLKMFNKQDLLNRKLENYIVNYCISTGINTNIESWQCIKAKRKAQATQATSSIDASSTADLEVESSSFIFQEKTNDYCRASCSKPKVEMGTMTRDIHATSSTPRYPSQLKHQPIHTHPPTLEKDTSIRGSVSDECMCLKKQQPIHTIYAPKPHAKDVKILKCYCKRKYFVSTSIPATEVTDVRATVPIHSDDKRQKVQYFHAVTQDRMEVPITPTPVKCTAECAKERTKVPPTLVKCTAECQTRKVRPRVSIEADIEKLPTLKTEEVEYIHEKIEILEQKVKSDQELLLEGIEVLPKEEIVDQKLLQKPEKDEDVEAVDDVSGITSVDMMEDVWYIPPKAKMSSTKKITEEEPSREEILRDVTKKKIPLTEKIKKILHIKKDDEEKTIPEKEGIIEEKTVTDITPEKIITKKFVPMKEITEEFVDAPKEELEEFYSPRLSIPSECKELEERIQILESELATANDTIYKLRESTGVVARVSAENEALRRHSIEVQDVAKDQIEDLINHLKKAQLRVAALEDENKRLNELNYNNELEHKELKQLIQELQKQNEELQKTNKQLEEKTYDEDIINNLKKELEKVKLEKADMEKILTKDLITSSGKTSLLEDEIKNLNEILINLQDLNKSLEQKLSTCVEQNQILSDNLNKTKLELQHLKDTQISEKELAALKKENENLLQKLDISNREVDHLMEKLKTPILEDLISQPQLEDKGAIKTIVGDLETQLKGLEPVKGALATRTEDMQKIINELTKRLDDAERRTTKAEEMLSTYKLSDPTAMFKDELNKYKAKILELEAENKDLSKLTNEIDKLRKELLLSENKNKTCSEENEQLKEKLQHLEGESVKPTAGLLETAGDDVLKNEIKKLQERLLKLTNENSGLQGKAAELDRALNKIDQLQKEIGELKRDSLKEANDMGKLKRELENALKAKAADANKLDLLEKEKTKNLTSLQSLENELAKLKKELESCLSTAQESSSIISKQQEEIAALKKKMNQLEGDKNKIKKDLDNAVAALKYANEKQEKKASETDKILQQYEQLLKENQRVLKENEKLMKDEELSKKERSKIMAEADREVVRQREKPTKLEPEIAKRDEELKDLIDKLKKQVSSLQDQNSQLNKEIERNRNELLNLSKTEEKQKILTDEVNKANTENVRLNAELNKILDDLQKTTATNIQNQEEIKKLKQKLALLESENDRLKKEINSVLDDSKSSSAEISKLKDSELTVKQRLAQLEAENLKLKNNLDAANATNKGNVSKIEHLNSTISKLQEENKNLKHSLDLAMKDLSSRDEAAIFKQKAAQTEDALNKLKKELNDALDDHKKCPKVISQLEKENAKLKKQITDLEKENEKLKGQYEGAMGDFKKTTLELEKLKGEDAKLKKQLSQLENDKSELNKEIVVMRTELGKIDSLLSKSKDDVVALKQKNATLEDANISFKNNLDLALKDKDKLQKSYNDLKNENTKLKEKIVQLESENARLKKDIENLTSVALKKDIHVKDDLISKDRLAELEKENKKLKGELNIILDEAKQSATAKDHEIKLKQQLAKLEAEHNKLKNELEAALAQAQTGSGQVSHLKNENNKLEQKIRQLESEISNLRKDLNIALEEAKKGATSMSAAQDADAKLKQRLAKLEKDNNKLNKDLQSALKEAKSGSDATTNLRDENAKQKQLVLQLQAEIAKLKEKADAAEDKARKLIATDDVADLKKKLKQLEQQNSSLKQNLDGAYGDAKNTADENSRLIDENAELKKQIKSLQNKLDSAKQALVICEDEKKQLNLNIAKMKENEVKIKKQLLELEKENVGMKQTLDTSRGDSKVAKKAEDDNVRLKDDFLQAQKELETVQGKLKDALNEIKKKTNEIQKLKDDIVVLKQKIATFEKEIATVKNDLDTCLSENLDLKKDQGDNMSSMRKQFENDIKNILKKNEESVDKLQKSYQEKIQSLNKKHDAEMQVLKESLRKALEELDQVTAERDQLKVLLEDQQRKSLSIKEKVEQVEDIITRERRRSQDERLRGDLLAEKLDEQEKVTKELKEKAERFKRKSEELERISAEIIKKATISEKEKQRLRKDSLEAVSGHKLADDDLAKDRQLRKDKKDKATLKAETFKIVSLEGIMPNVIPITTPLSDKELKFFGKKICTCKPNIHDIINKIAVDGLESLSIEELQFLHFKLCDATAEQLAKVGQSSGVLRPNENSKLGLLRRIAALEGDLLKKQKHAQQKVIAMQYAVKLEKERLLDLKKILDEEKKKNSDLLNQIESQTKIVANIREERDSIQRQKSYHEQKLEQYIVTIEEERAKTRHLEDELEKEKTTVLHFKSLLESERDRARLNKRKDSEALERMRTKLEKTTNSEMVLKMKLQDSSKTRSHSPSMPVKDVSSHPMSTKSRTYFYSSASDNRHLRADSVRRLSYNNLSTSRLEK
ncbi:unnamed protein product [Diabrotica balteata]|uniref:Uncharacterized protein n=1 Tax=Diabrotica balteata TaxID=107213 RepID=A0A9P0GZF7_DIABA|nr:unnamed protein product [Diabrotica balteata]